MPSNWVKEATSRDTVIDPSLDYQYFWWILFETGDFLAIGNHGQFIYIDPATDVVVVRMGTSYGGLHYLEWANLLGDVAQRLMQY